MEQIDTDALNEELIKSIHRDIMLLFLRRGVIDKLTDYEEMGLKDLADGVLNIKKAVKFVYADEVANMID